MEQTAIEDLVARLCAASPVVAGEEGRHDIGAFTFENGQRLEQVSVGFVTHGRLNARRDNALLLLPGTTNSRHSADGYIGSGNAFDPDRHFIISFEAIGSGTSSKPSDGLGADFPRYNNRDLVRSQVRVVAERFGLQRVSVAGASMGAFQALEWAIAEPQMVDRVVLIVPAARAGTVFRSVVRTALDVLQLDAAWGSEMPDMEGLASLRAVMRLYFPWTVTDHWLETVPAALIEQEIQAAIARSARWHPWDFLRRYEASASHDVAAPFGGDVARALAQVRAPTLILPTTTERLLGSGSGSELHRHIAGSTLVEVPSQRGHLGWRAVPGAAESRTIATHVAHFLKETNP